MAALNDCPGLAWDELAIEDDFQLSFWACLLEVDVELLNYSVRLCGPSSFSVQRHLQFIAERSAGGIH